MPPVTITTVIEDGGGIPPPSIYSPAYTIEIVTTNYGTITCASPAMTNSSDVYSWSIERGVGELMRASVQLTNAGGSYSSRVTGGETLNIYFDYGSGTTLVFSGIIDEPLYGLDLSRGWYAEVHARQKPQLADQTVIAQYTNTAADTIVKAIIDDNFAGVITYANLPSGLGTATVDFRHETGLSAIKQTLDQINYVCYIDASGDLHAFERGTVTNGGESLYAGVNVMSANGIGRKIKDIKNRFFVYGQNANNTTNVFYLATKQDTSLQTQYWKNDEVINDTSITSVNEALQRAQAEFYLKTVSTVEGGVTCFGGLPTLNPGELLDVQIPYCNAQAYFEARSVNTSFAFGQGVVCEVYLSRDNTGFADLFKSNKTEAEEKRNFQNPNAMLNSSVLTFDDASGVSSSSGVQFVNGAMTLTSGNTTGYVTMSISIPLSFTSVDFRMSGEQLSNTEVTVSQDNVTFFSLTEGQQYTFSSSGTQLYVKVLLTSTNDLPVPSMNAFGIYYK